MQDSFRLPATGFISQVTLRTRDASRLQTFYESVIGLKLVAATATVFRLSASGQEPAQLVLEQDAQAPMRNPQSPGLFHVAWLLPSRPALAQAFRHLQEVGWPLQGLADHLVSEAIYLADPDGNGIELYADRPQDTWPVQNGQVQMATLPINVPDLLGSISSDTPPWSGFPADTSIGHLHLQVSLLPKAKSFYCDLLGFNIRQDTYPGALFVAASDYHHHLGLNTWRSLNQIPGPANQTGLVNFTIQLPDTETWQELKVRFQEGEATFLTVTDRSFTVTDPDHNQLLFRF